MGSRTGSSSEMVENTEGAANAGAAFSGAIKNTDAIHALGADASSIANQAFAGRDFETADQQLVDFNEGEVKKVFSIMTKGSSTISQNEFDTKAVKDPNIQVSFLNLNGNTFSESIEIFCTHLL